MWSNNLNLKTIASKTLSFSTLVATSIKPNQAAPFLQDPVHIHIPQNNA